jgi:hypothetical protein
MIMKTDLLLLKWCPEMAVFTLSVNSKSPSDSYVYTDKQLDKIMNQFIAMGGKMDLQGWKTKAKANPNIDIMYFANKIT